MSESSGEGIGKFRIAIDPAIRPAFKRLPTKIQDELRRRLISASTNPADIRAVLVEGQWMIDGTVMDGDKLYYYSGVRFSYDAKNHVIALTGIPAVRPIKGGIH